MRSFKVAPEFTGNLHQETREEIAKKHGGKVVCGTIIVPGDKTNTTNLLANLREIQAMALEIAKKRRGR